MAHLLNRQLVEGAQHSIRWRRLTISQIYELTMVLISELPDYSALKVAITGFDSLY